MALALNDLQKVDMLLNKETIKKQFLFNNNYFFTHSYVVSSIPI